MTEILIEYELSLPERKQLCEEFPKYKFYFESEKELRPTIEIFFGEKFPEIKGESQLKWLHTPSSSLQGLPRQFLKKHSIFVTVTKEQNHRQAAEFVIGAILLFAKQFFHLQKVSHDPEEFSDWSLKQSMWTLSDKVILQLGLGSVGTQIVQQAEHLGMKTWGIKKEGGFHPHCNKTFDFTQLHSILPATQVLSIALPIKANKELIGYDELMLLPADSILICIGSSSCINEEALAQVASTGKFRGIILDCFQHAPLQKNSPLWGMANTIITPQVASYPRIENRVAFMDFRKKLRLYVAGKLAAMLPVQL